MVQEAMEQLQVQQGQQEHQQVHLANSGMDLDLHLLLEVYLQVVSSNTAGGGTVAGVTSNTVLIRDA